MIDKKRYCKRSLPASAGYAAMHSAVSGLPEESLLTPELVAEIAETRNDLWTKSQ